MTITDEQLMILVVVLIAGYYLYNRYEGFSISGKDKGKHHHRRFIDKLDHSFGHPFGNYPYEYQEPVYEVRDNWNRRNRERLESYDVNLYNRNRNRERLESYDVNLYNRNRRQLRRYNENRYYDYESQFNRPHYYF